MTIDLRPGLSKLTVPLQVLMPYNPADQSPYSPEQTLAFYQSLLAGAPHTKVVPISPARHFLLLDRPEATQAAVTEFLNSLNH